MDDNEIIRYVNAAVYSDGIMIHDLIDKSAEYDEFQQYKMMTAYRFLHFWRKYKRGMIKQYDMEVSLRNYLLVLNADIDLPGYTISEEGDFGLSQNGTIIKVNYNLPEYINSDFVRTAFMNGYEHEKEKNKYILDTNPFIRNLTGFKKYKSIEQKLTVLGALDVPPGYSCMVSMSTGGGKSLVTQTVSYQAEKGLTLIIVPTISLMLDQYKNASRIIKTNVESEIFYYYSGIDNDEIIKAINDEKARMLFLSPEALLKNTKLKEVIESANGRGYLKNLIVDEAHIIIEWGTSFRVDFQCIDSMRRTFMKENSSLRTYLLSATFSRETANQIKRFYSDDNKWIEIRCDKLRKEPRYDVVKASNKNDKLSKMLKLISVLPRPMIVYVKSPREAEELKSLLMKNGYGNVKTFTGSTGNSTREKLIRQWAENDFDIMVATCAFGVGVDKKDVRTVLHLYIPENPNKYYQEAGRGGRDGLPCLSVILYNSDDVTAAFNLTQKVMTVEKIIGRWFSMLNSGKTIRKQDEIIIDTSVKPSYNEKDDDYFADAADIDVTWNVYVILLLRRNDIVRINNVTYQNGVYFFSLEILNRKILSQNYEMEEMVSEIREKEVKFVSSEYRLIKNALDSVGRECWSEMFNAEYNLTDEYCAGCNCHKDINDGGHSDFPLKRKIELQTKKINENIKNLTDNSPNLLIQYSSDIHGLIDGLINKGTDVIVVPDNMMIDCMHFMSNDSSTVNIMNYYEFFKLKENSYFLCGTLAIVYEENNKNNERIINTVRKMNLSSIKLCLIHLIQRDFVISSNGKYISELIDGPLKSDYLLDMEVM